LIESREKDMNLIGKYVRYIINVELKTIGLYGLSACHISWRSVKPLPRYRDFLIFQDGVCHHL